MECSKTVTEMPLAERAILEFTHYSKMMEVPCVVYADFECILEKINEVVSSKNKFERKHIPCAFAYFVKCRFDDSLSKFRIYTGKDAAEKFVESLSQDCNFIYDNYLRVKKNIISLTPTEDSLFLNAIVCHICKKELGNERVRDHCHLTGKFRGAAHNECNLKFRVPNFIPIFFHNFSSYDCHLFIKELAKLDGDIKVIPLNKELYISLSHTTYKGERSYLEMRFLDSLRFMPESLDKLASNLAEEDFHSVKSLFSDPYQFTLMVRKGVLPYEFLDSFDRLDDNTLPPIDAFFNTLNNKKCSDEDYYHARKVWETFNCSTVKSYLEIYLKADVLILTDVFEKFRKVCMDIYGLDPCHFFTAPGLSFDAMLKCTKAHLELLVDVDMYNFFKNGIRGGLVQCCKRHAKANNIYMKDYDDTKSEESILYLDANNLYGWAMCEYLPTGNFKWEEVTEDIIKKIRDTPKDSPTGYVLSVDLDCPDECHDLQNDLPFCPENKTVESSKYKKLIADFTPKRDYTIHYRVLNQCLDNKLVLRKVHRILSFDQEPWLKKYIDENTKHRMAATNTFEKNFYKLLNNAVYGKTMENVDKRKEVHIVTSWERTNKNRLGAQDWIAKSNFHSVSYFSEDMVAIQMKKVKVVYDKPIYLGFCVLELSKWKMYDFHYNVMKPRFGENLELLYMDTDSFIYLISNVNFFVRITLEDIEKYFDTSEYPENNVFNFPRINKKKLGMMKDENCGKIMTEFVGLRSKMYSFTLDTGDEIKKSKGVKKCILEKYSISNYRDSVLNKKVYHDDMLTFKSKMHQIYTNKLSKVTLSYNDDKRKIRSDGISTYAWGHYRIRNEENPDYELDMLLLDIQRLQEENG